MSYLKGTTDSVFENEVPQGYQRPSCYQVRTVLLLPWWPRGPCCQPDNPKPDNPTGRREAEPTAFGSAVPSHGI